MNIKLTLFWRHEFFEEDRVVRELAEKGKLKLVKQMILEYHHHTEPEKEKLGEFLKLLEAHGFGYQLQTDYMPLNRKKGKQGILIYAYQK